MPEALEVETYRRKFTLTGLDRVIVAVEAPDPWYLKRGLTADGIADALVGHSFRRVRRRGKLLLVDSFESGSTLVCISA